MATARIAAVDSTMAICSADPAALITDELSPRQVARPQPALTDVDQVRAFLRQRSLATLRHLYGDSVQSSQQVGVFAICRFHDCSLG